MTKFLDVNYLIDAGLSLSSRSFRFFMRTESLDLLNSLSKNDFVLVEGPPGVGKSVGVWIWACHQSYFYSLTWIHFDTMKIRYCAFQNGVLMRQSFTNEEDVIFSIVKSQSDVLIIDGLVSSNKTISDIARIYREAYEWKNSTPTRKLIFISSLQAIIIKTEDATFTRHFVPSWKLEDYQNAFSDDSFLDSHLEFLSGDSDAELADNILNKYFLAGGSARWMLGFTPAKVVEDAMLHVNKGWDIKDLVAGLTGTRSNLAVNHLLQSIDKEESVFLVSEFVTRLLTEKCALEFLKVAINCPLAKNPSFDGWIMEADFLLQIRLSEKQMRSISLLDFQNSKEAEFKVANWFALLCIPFTDVVEIASLVTTDSLLGTEKRHLIIDNTWLLPQRWNQGCYDAIQLLSSDKLNVVRIIQVTRAGSHSLKFKYINTLLNSLDTAGFKITSVELVFILPSDHSPEIFKLSKVEGKLLPKYQTLLNRKGYEGGEYFLYGFTRTKM